MIMNLSAGAQVQPVFLKALAYCTIKLQWQTDNLEAVVLTDRLLSFQNPRSAPWYFCSQVVHQPSLIRVKEWHQCFKGRTTNSGQGVYLLRLTRFIFWFRFQLLVRIVFLLGKNMGTWCSMIIRFFLLILGFKELKD
jgi:hypothetical protein